MKKKMWHCKNCGTLCETFNGVCPECGLDLGFYGEVQFVEAEDAVPIPPPVPQPEEPLTPPPPVSQPEEPPVPPPEAESGLGKVPKPKKERKPKEPKKKGKRSALLPIAAAAAAVLVLLVLGSTMFMTRVDSLRVHAVADWDKNDHYQVYYVEDGAQANQTIEVFYKGFLGKQPELTVTSSDSNVVQVSVRNGDNGTSTVTLRVKSPGTASITARAGNESYSYQVKAYQITGVELTVPEFPDEVSLGLGDSVSYTADLQCTGSIDKTWLPSVEVTSSNPDVVKVDSESGELIAKGSGSAVVTASTGNYEESISVNVFEVTNIELDCYDLLVDNNGKTMNWLPEGLTMGLDIIYYYDGEMGSTVLPYTLKSSNNKVLSVDPNNFTITAVGAGKATITATMAGYTDSVTLEVYPVDRSSGAWVRGSLDSIAAPASGSTTRADYTVALRFGDGISYVSVPTYYGTGGTETQTRAWENVSDQYPNEGEQVQSRDMHITLQGSKWEQKRTIAGITFLFKRADSDTSDYDPATDLLDYWVIYTK